MKRFVIERDIPGIGNLSPEEYAAGAKRSNSTLDDLGTGIKWEHSYVTGDRIYCVYLAENEDIIRRHAAGSGFPANRIEEVRRVMDPSTANA